MNKSLLFAAMAAGVFTAACSGNGGSPLPPSMTAPGSAASGLRSPEKAPPGWAATATRAIPEKDLASAGSAKRDGLPNLKPLHVVVGLYMRDPAAARQLVASQYTPGHASYRKWLSPAAIHRDVQSDGRPSRIRRVVSAAARIHQSQDRLESSDRKRLRRCVTRGSRIPHLDPRHGRERKHRLRQRHPGVRTGEVPRPRHRSARTEQRISNARSSHEIATHAHRWLPARRRPAWKSSTAFASAANMVRRNTRSRTTVPASSTPARRPRSRSWPKAT